MPSTVDSVFHYIIPSVKRSPFRFLISTSGRWTGALVCGKEGVENIEVVFLLPVSSCHLLLPVPVLLFTRADPSKTCSSFHPSGKHWPDWHLSFVPSVPGASIVQGRGRSLLPRGVEAAGACTEGAVQGSDVGDVQQPGFAG